MPNTITEAKEAAIRRDERHRIAAFMVEACPPKAICQYGNKPRDLGICYEHWLEYLEPSQ